MFLVKRMEDFDFKPTNNSLLSLLGRTSIVSIDTWYYVAAVYDGTQYQVSIEVETSAVGYLPVYGCLDDLRKDYPDADYEEIQLKEANNET